MESADRDLIMQLIKSNMQLKRLYEEHESLEDRLSKYIGRSFLTPQEELEQKRLKVKKLQGVDKMMNIIADYRAAA